MPKNITKIVKKEREELIKWLDKQKMDEKGVEDFIKELINAHRIFVNGAGRSLLVARGFAMRLMHLGFEVYVIGDTTTPSVSSNDLYIVVSGSGESKIKGTRIASGIGARIVAITSFKNSTQGKLADKILIVPGRKKEEMQMEYKERRMRGTPIAPLATLFELAVSIILESVISGLAIEKTEKELKGRHARPEE